MDQDVSETEAPARFTVDAAGGQASASHSAPLPDAGPPRPTTIARLRLGQWVGLVVTLLAIVLIAGVAVGARALESQDEARREIIGQLDPAQVAALQLSAAIVAQQNGVRGYALNALPSNLDAYQEARASAARYTGRLQRLVDGDPTLNTRIDAIGREMEAWRAQFAQQTIERVGRIGPSSAGPIVGRRSVAQFAKVTGAEQALVGDIDRRRAAAQERLDDAARSTTVSFFVIAGVLALSLVAAAIAMRRAITRPLERLAADARTVSRGDLEHRLEGGGPADVVQLAGDVDSMRLRILADLDQVRESRVRVEEQARELSEQARDLKRSNAELEQFAYVASHDLQEPLRKVASFCQLLQRRYEGQLDERADLYIGFAVDGAKRMQSLISDLLAFSRVGRSESDTVDVALGDALQGALDNLTNRVQETNADVRVGTLPIVRGEPVLLTAVFQNLVGNALKFSGGERPEIHVSAERDDGVWTITCSDRGIGIDPEYGERIFAIFQRLHPKETYEGTGIGLALCRKIVEHHGGRIWLDADVPVGATFRFTLPATPETTA